MNIFTEYFGTEIYSNKLHNEILSRISLNKDLAILSILPRKFFEKYRNSGYILNFQIYIILILFFPKTDFLF